MGLEISQRLRKDHLEPLSNNKRKKDKLLFSIFFDQTKVASGY